MTDSKALALSEDVRPNHALASVIYENAANIVPFLPAGVTLDRVVAAVGRSILKNPDLAKCTPTSVILGVSAIQQWGLEIGETAYLVPYGREATPVRDYKGDIQMLINAGACRDVETHCVYENEMDSFVCTYGTRGYIQHQPIHYSDKRGKMVGVYVLFRLRFGHSKHFFMTIDEVEQVRQKHSKQWKGGEMPYWYAWKTVIKRGAKLLAKDPKTAKVLALFESEPDLNPDDEIQPAVIPSTPTREGVPATAASAFEEAAAAERAEVTLPNWQSHPLANLPLSKVETNDLAQLYSQLKDAAVPKYDDLVGHIAVELDARRNAA